MDARRTGGALTVLGGLVWLLWAVLDLVGDAPGEGALFLWSGLALVLAGGVCVGLTLVHGPVRWLSFVVALAVPLLVWALYETVRSVGGGSLVHAGLGVVALAAGAALVARGRAQRPEASSARVPSHRA